MLLVGEFDAVKLWSLGGWEHFLWSFVVSPCLHALSLIVPHAFLWTKKKLVDTCHVGHFERGKSEGIESTRENNKENIKKK